MDNDKQQPVINSLCLVGLLALLVYAWYLLAGKPCPPPLPDWPLPQQHGSPTLIEDE